MTDFRSAAPEPERPETDQPAAPQESAPVRYDLAGNPLPPAPGDSSTAAPHPFSGGPAAPVSPSYPNVAPSAPPYPNPAPVPIADPRLYPPSMRQLQAPPTPEARMKTAVLAAVGALLLVVLGTVFWTRAKHPPLVASPGSYSLYVSPDKTFTCQGPLNWESHGFGTESSSVGGVTFQKGAAKIEITSDFEGSLYGDIFKAPPAPDDSSQMSSDGVPQPPQVPPIDRLHAMYRSTVRERYDRYREGAMVPFSSPGFGDARYSEFRARRGIFGPDLHGVRVTLLGTQRAMIVVCECPEANWDTLKDSFWKVVMSLQQGNG